MPECLCGWGGGRSFKLLPIIFNIPVARQKAVFLAIFPHFLKYGKSATKSSKFTQCTIQPAEPKQWSISKKSAKIVFENSAQVVLQFLYNEVVGMC